MAKLIGLTGGIGSGKTTIADFFSSLGVPVYIADNEARAILYTPDAVSDVKDVFGDAVFTDGIPDRAKLATVVFNDPEKLKMLNGIIHPMVGRHFLEWRKRHEHEKIIIREAAILFESGTYKDCDSIILVTAPIEVRIQRVMKRDNISRQKVMERIGSQWDDEKKAVLSNYIITNIDIEDAKKQAVEILKILNKIEN